MGEYVDVNVPEVLSAASRIQGTATNMREKMRTVLDRVEAAEGRPEVFAPDEFTAEFLKTYHSQLPVGGQMNVAVRENAAGMGDAMHDMGQIARDAMWAYSGVDDHGADEIAKT